MKSTGTVLWTHGASYRNSLLGSLSVPVASPPRADTSCDTGANLSVHKPNTVRAYVASKDGGCSHLLGDRLLWCIEVYEEAQPSVPYSRHQKRGSAKFTTSLRRAVIKHKCIFKKRFDNSCCGNVRSLKWRSVRVINTMRAMMAAQLRH